MAVTEGHGGGSPVLVIGGTGKTGRRVAARLAARGRTAVAASRSGERHFDWRDRTTWELAVAGVSAAYLVDAQSEDAAALMADFARLAARSGVGRLVLLSARAWEQSRDDAAFAVERAVRDSGAAWTILRPTWFAQNFGEESFLRDAVAAGRVELPTGQGLEPFIDAEDIAECAAAALADDGHEGEVYALSGPRLMTFGDGVGEIAAAVGREIAYVPVSKPQYVTHLLGRGFDEGYAEFAAELLGAVADDGGAYLSDGVERLLGRPPRDFAEYVARTLPSGVWQRPAD
ncbi:SDR family NAD(P)-dependent oxidoreductase [Streptomyces sp. NPDC047525]|uniref:SDR family NAD(P)-dependent oxidoreductase n=1 Tax=Streptomyces sp. NPDC047525 TaxID=3155264 RepID=UPI0033FB2913